MIVCGETVYVGWFTRTNHAGPKRLAHLLFPHGYRVKTVEVTGCLHLKSALTGVASGRLLANPVWANLKRVGGMEVLDEYKDTSFNSKELGRGRSLLGGGEAGDETGDVGEQQDKTKWALEMGA